LIIGSIRGQVRESHKSNMIPEQFMIGDAIKKYGEDEGRTELRIEES
jgi:hypothetical protein